ncbi:MAG: hypothetical protein EBV01_13860 [Betaproteobacteria bacterium]|nr:hypothetical protein [Betaproteobacteria bacterium]NCY08386.1 hypothetical protein [Betaproteobacteria bacterium]NDG13166.1 hypothetical protein [Betaproteobacteria bacterium]
MTGFSGAAWAFACPGVDTLKDDATLEQLRSLQDLQSVLGPSCEDDPGFLFLSGMLSRRLGAFEQASNWLERSLLVGPQRPDVLLEYALVRQILGDRETAKLLLERLLSDYNPPELVANLIRTQLAALNREVRTLRPEETAPHAERMSSLTAFASALSGQWSIARSFDSNLNSAPSAKEISFTTLDGPLVLPLNPQDRPKSAASWQVDARLASGWQAGEQGQWGLSARTFARAGVDSALQSQSVDVALDYAHPLARTPSDQGQAGARAASRLLIYGVGQYVRFGGNPLARLGRMGLAHEQAKEIGQSLCRWQQGVEAEQRHYPERQVLDGRSAYLGSKLLCSTNKWQGEISVRMGRDWAEHAGRAGGDQARADLGWAMSWESAIQRIRLQGFTTVNSDSIGYNQLIQNNKIRLVIRHGLGIEYARMKIVPGWEWVISVEGFQQRSTLALFVSEGWSVATGFRKRF